MKVLLGHCFYRTSAPSGEDIAYENEKRMLTDHGLEVILYEKHNDDLLKLRIAGKAKLAISNSWSIKAYQELQSLIKKYKPDIAHFHNTFPQISPSGYAACKYLGLPVVHTLHNYRLICPAALLMRNNKPCELCLAGSFKPALKYNCYRNSKLATASQVLCLYRNRKNGSYKNNVDKFIALTDFAKKKFIQAGFSSDQLVTRPNFLPNPPEPANNKENFALFVGRLTSEKGILTLLKAWKDVKGLELKIIGDGQLFRECNEYVNKYVINSKFYGHLSNEETIEFIKKAKFMILPSEWYEGFPITLLEAFACGTPIIVSNIGGPAEIVKDHQNGIHFNSGDSYDLLEKCLSLKKDTELQNKLSFLSRETFLNNYTEEAVFKKTMSIYESLV